MIITTQNILLLGSILLFISIMIGKTGIKLGIPVLLLFLIVGMGFGRDGFGIEFENPVTAQFIGVISLSIILFSGGMDTNITEIKPVIGQGITLATLGVLLTTAFTGGFVYLLASWAFPEAQAPLLGCLLLAAVMSSTDSASVFNILRSKDLNLKHNLRPLLELESGSNDPMAYMLTILLIQIIQSGEFSFGQVLLSFFIQFSVGGIAGYLLTLCCLYVKPFQNPQPIPLPDCSSDLCIFHFLFYRETSGERLSGGIYCRTGRRESPDRIQKKILPNFFDSTAWLFQIIMFLTLGLLVNPKDLISISWLGLLIGIFMIIFARPVSVLLCLLPSAR